MKRYKLPSYIAKMAAKLAQFASIIKLPSNAGVTVEQARKRADKTLYNALVQLAVNKAFAVKNNIMPSLLPLPSITKFVVVNVGGEYLRVTVSGANFMGTTQVLGPFNAPVNFAVSNDSTIVFALEIGDTLAKVTVKTPGGTAQSTNKQPS